MPWKNIPHIIFKLLLILLFLPGLQGLTAWINVKALKGAVEKLEEPVFTLADWFHGNFQEKYYPYVEQQLGFRADFVRLNNQLDFSLFDIIHANSVILGKNQTLYELNYIHDYTGANFIGEKAADEIVTKLSRLQQVLKSRNVDLLVVLAPGKASFFPEDIPDRYLEKGLGMSNYHYYADAMTRAGIPLLDFNRFFLQIRDTVSWPLYHKGGIHWSMYGMTLCADSLFRYLEQLRGIQMVDFDWDGVEISQKLKNTDNDIGDGLNLFQDIDHEPGAYPRWKFTEDAASVKPDVITIADSYYWTIYGNGISARMFRNNIFWYYFTEEYVPGQPVRKITDFDVKEAIEKNQILILMSTEANLNKFPFGFLESVYPLYFSEKK